MTHIAPARYALTVLHRQDPGIPPVPAGPDPSTGMTVCGSLMLTAESWVPVDCRPGDRLCGGCEAPETAPAEDIQETLL